MSLQVQQPVCVVGGSTCRDRAGTGSPWRVDICMIHMDTWSGAAQASPVGVELSCPALRTAGQEQ